MRILVTGGAGFLGSHVIRHWLAQHPAEDIVNLDLMTYAGSPARLDDLRSAPRHRVVRGDIREERAVRDSMRGCETVVHFAAETHVDRSITDAGPFIRTNVEGTCRLLQEALLAGVKRFIHISTDEVCGPVLTGTADERAPLAPRSPYAASKAAAECFVQAYRETFGLPTVIVRPTNIFGPWQLPEKFIPLCVTNALEERSIPIYGDGTQRRSWLFIDDLCSALQAVIERGTVGEIYNVPGTDEPTNLDTATRILEQLGRPVTLLQHVPDRPGHDRRYALDGAKLQRLGWRPRVSFEDGLAATVAWYRAHHEWWRPLTQQLREDPYHWLNRPAGTGSHQTSRRLV